MDDKVKEIMSHRHEFPTGEYIPPTLAGKPSKTGAGSRCADMKTTNTVNTDSPAADIVVTVDNRGYPLAVADPDRPGVYHHATGHPEAALALAERDGVANPILRDDLRKYRRRIRDRESKRRRALLLRPATAITADPEPTPEPVDPIAECRARRRVRSCAKCLRYGSPDRSRICYLGQGPDDHNPE